MTVVRPVFREGAILAAADLSTLESADRDRDARHARHLHTPGVGAGLDLLGDDRTTTSGAAYRDLRLRAGYAVDGTGRELVLSEDRPLSPDRFRLDNPNPTTETGRSVTVWHPVFVRGVDADPPPSGVVAGCGPTSGTSRTEEDVEIEFGRPGDTGLPQVAPAPGSGPGNGAWRVLVGFVRFDVQLGRFTEETGTADAVRADRAGVRAALVVAPEDQVQIRAGRTADAGVAAVVLDGTGGGSLTFGRHDGTGRLAPLLQVDARGNLTVPGTIRGTMPAGTVRMVGGVAFDGVVLPLPAGVTQAAVDSGAVDVVVQLSPRLPAADPTGQTFYVPVECRVDGDRRVHCSGLPQPPPAAGAAPPVAGACDYVVLAAVPGGGA